MKTFRVKVENWVEVTVDETQFSEGFMAEFRAIMYPFSSIDRHIEHLAWLYSRGMADSESFIEGYGPAKNFGIKFEYRGSEMEIQGEDHES